MSLRDLLANVPRGTLDAEPAKRVQPRLRTNVSSTPVMQSSGEAVLEALYPRSSVMPDNVTNPFDQAIRDYQKLSDELDQQKARYAQLDDNYVKACDAARGWEARSKMFEREADKYKQERDEALRTVVELSTVGRMFVELGAKMSEIANSAPRDEYAPKQNPHGAGSPPDEDDSTSDMPLILTNNRLPENKL